MTAESQLRDLIGKTWADPLLFVRIAFPWGEGVLEGHDGPDDWQIEALNDIRAHIVSGKPLSLRAATASGHGIGKSALTAWIILWFASTRPQCAGVVTANTQAQLRSKTWRELSVWHQRALNRHWFEWTATRFQAVEAPRTWGIDAIPWSEHNPEAFAGLHADDVLVIFDEASAVADTIWETTEGAMTTPGSFWLTYGNPTRNSGRFHRCFHADRARWQVRSIDARTCKMPNKAELDTWVNEYGEDSDFVRVRVRGMFPRAGSNQLIGYDLIEQATRREAVPDTSSPRVMGVDVARHGDDQSVILVRTGSHVEHIQRLRIPDTMQVASRVAEAIIEHRPDAVMVDASGMGWSVVDRLRQLGHDVIAVQVGERAHDPERYYNLRSELWGRMRDWLKEIGKLPEDRELQYDLTAPEYGFDTRMRLQLERKEDMKKRGLASPDSGDALALTFDQPVARGNISAVLDREPPNWRAA